MEYPTCETCRKKHPGECYRKTGACFKCGKHGHLFKNCPNVGNATQKVKRDQLTQGCVYVLIRHDAEVSPSMVADELPGILPEREVEFKIDLAPDTRSISKALY
nr:uncharacterized protein LOC125421824 [Ziziphus jujuba var. spinosa]